MPGTTVTDETRKQENLSGGIFNGSAFVGGVSIGEYGIAVYDQAPATNNYFTSKLYARKSYFMFDNEIVAVGSGITDDSGTMVYTTVENRIWRKDDVFTVDGKAVSLTDQEIDDKVKYMHFTNMGGYVMLTPSDIKYQKITRGNTTFLEAWIEHGTSPQNAGYAYVYLPEATAKETAEYQASPDVEIISRTKNVHAVKDSKLGITGYAFYESGSCNGVTASTAITLIVEETADGIRVSVSDPSQKLKSSTVSITLDSLGKTITYDENIYASINGNTLSLNINFENNVGQSFSVTVK